MNGGGVWDFISIVHFFNKCFLFQDTVGNMSSGPEPPFFTNLIASLIPNIPDRTPIGKHFGDVLQPAKPEYRVVRLTGKSPNAFASEGKRKDIITCFEWFHIIASAVAMLVVAQASFNDDDVDRTTG